MTDDRTPVPGPIPVRVVTTATGAALESESLRRLIVEDIVAALLDGDDTTLWDRLHQLADPTPADVRPGDTTDRDDLIVDLAERCSSRIPLYGTAAIELTRRLRTAVAPRPIPGQQDRRAS